MHDQHSEWWHTLAMLRRFQSVLHGWLAWGMYPHQSNTCTAQLVRACSTLVSSPTIATLEVADSRSATLGVPVVTRQPSERRPAGAHYQV